MDGRVSLTYPSSLVTRHQPRYEGDDQAYTGSEANDSVTHWLEGEIQPALKVRSAVVKTELITTSGEQFVSRVICSWDGKLEITISVGIETVEDFDAEQSSSCC